MYCFCKEKEHHFWGFSSFGTYYYRT